MKTGDSTNSRLHYYAHIDSFDLSKPEGGSILMRSRKILCGFITVLLLVVSFSAAFPMADEEGVALQGEAPPVF